LYVCADIYERTDDVVQWMVENRHQLMDPDTCEWNYDKVAAAAQKHFADAADVDFRFAAISAWKRVADEQEICLRKKLEEQGGDPMELYRGWRRTSSRSGDMKRLTYKGRTYVRVAAQDDYKGTAEFLVTNPKASYSVYIGREFNPANGRYEHIGGLLAKYDPDSNSTSVFLIDIPQNYLSDKWEPAPTGAPLATVSGDAPDEAVKKAGFDTRD